MRSLLRALIVFAGLCVVWQAVVAVTGLPTYMLPPPTRVFAALFERADFLVSHALLTLAEIVLGMIGGILLGCLSALTLASFPPARRWLLPVLVVSQAIPVFALAPLLVLWLGYGMASKVAAAMLIIYFPVTSAFFDGLRHTERGWLDLARVMGAPSHRELLFLRAPAALPGLESGVRVAAAVAPIGAVIGEWVGASAGLGYVMLQANARMQIDVMFAALLVLGVMAVALYYAIDAALRHFIPWLPESLRAPSNGVDR
jgi:putative hydroxymethylpyrimidine transport system permease protein